MKKLFIEIEVDFLDLTDVTVLTASSDGFSGPVDNGDWITGS